MATDQQQAWLEEYLQCWNATEAARRADYAHPEIAGHRNKKKFADEIARRLEAKHMSAEEVLSRLADEARSDIFDFIQQWGTDWKLDLKAVKEAGLGHLIKKFKYNAQGQPEIELHDAQAAKKLIGQHLGMFKETVEVTGKDGGPILIEVDQ